MQQRILIKLKLLLKADGSTRKGWCSTHQPPAGAEYPEGYDRTLEEGVDGYVTPVLRTVWNAGAAAGWGFTSQQQVEALLGLG